MESTVTGFTQELGGVAFGTVAADDPRIVGTWTQHSNTFYATSRKPGEGIVGIANGTARIDNEEGAWVGTWSSFGGARNARWHLMEGEGALRRAHDGLPVQRRGNTFECVIPPSRATCASRLASPVALGSSVTRAAAADLAAVVGPRCGSDR